MSSPFHSCFYLCSAVFPSWHDQSCVVMAHWPWPSLAWQIPACNLMVCNVVIWASSVLNCKRRECGNETKGRSKVELWLRPAALQTWLLLAGRYLKIHSHENNVCSSMLKHKILHVLPDLQEMFRHISISTNCYWNIPKMESTKSRFKFYFLLVSKRDFVVCRPFQGNIMFNMSSRFAESLKTSELRSDFKQSKSRFNMESEFY